LGAAEADQKESGHQTRMMEGQNNQEIRMLKRSAIVITLLALFAVPLFARSASKGVDKDNLDKYGRGIIKDYSDMAEKDEIEWVWLAPGLRLSEAQFKVDKFENVTAVVDDDMEQVFVRAFPKVLQKAGSKSDDAPVVHVEGAIYWAERASSGKRWIPYAGGHLAQAGIGIELIFKNDKGEIIAKIRHSGREGDKLQSAAEELADDIANFVKAN
jgi:hypothetical protein